MLADVIEVLKRWDANGYWDLSPFDAEISFAIVGNVHRSSDAAQILAHYKNGNMLYSFEEFAKHLITVLSA